MVSEDVLALVKSIPIPQYLLEAVPEIAPSLVGVDLDLYDKQVCLCPVHHEKTPSFRWFENTNTCFCFGCGVGGDIINLHRCIMNANEEERVSFDEAVSYLHERFISGNEHIKLQDINETVSKAEQLMFEHTVLNRVSPKNFEIAENLSLLVRLGKLSGAQAIEYYQKRGKK